MQELYLGEVGSSSGEGKEGDSGDAERRTSQYGATQLEEVRGGVNDANFNRSLLSIAFSPSCSPCLVPL